jgi:hypothetical protein
LEAEELNVAFAYDYTCDVTTLAPRVRVNRAPDATAFGRSSNWMLRAAERLKELTRLPPGWDGHAGHPLSPPIADYTFQLLEKLMLRPGVPLPSITPLAYGGVMLEWHRRGWDIEIEIDAPTSHHVFTRELATSAEENFVLSGRLGRLHGEIAKIAD